MEYFVLEKPLQTRAPGTGRAAFDYLVLYRMGEGQLWRHAYFSGVERLFGGRFVQLATTGFNESPMTQREVDALIGSYTRVGWAVVKRSAYWCGREVGLTFSLTKALVRVGLVAPFAAFGALYARLSLWADKAFPAASYGDGDGVVKDDDSVFLRHVMGINRFDDYHFAGYDDAMSSHTFDDMGSTSDAFDSDWN